MKLPGIPWPVPDQGVEPPLSTGLAPTGGGSLEYAEFGDRDGSLVLWLHGTPGSCRQVAPAAKTAAVEAGLRVVGVARPGVGRSSRLRHPDVLSVSRDLVAVADHLGEEEFAVVGLSGGGPYALGVAAAAPERVAGVAVLGGVAPTVGPDAIRGGLTGLLPVFEPLVRTVDRPAGWAMTQAIKPLIPFGSSIYDRFSSLMPEGDQAVFATPGVKEMFIDDLSRGIVDGGMYAVTRDAVLFGRDWGFRLADVDVPVHWWHGDADTIVAADHGRHAAERLPNAQFTLRPGDSHLSGYAAADHVIEVVSAFLSA